MPVLVYLAIPETDPASAERAAARVGAAGGGGAGARNGGGRPATLIVTRPVGEAIAGDRLVAIGDGEARASVSVHPREAGILADIAVGSGEAVGAGDTLAVLDSELQAVARDIAARSVADETISRDRLRQLMRQGAGTRADLDVAENALARARLTLRESSLRLDRRSIPAPIGGRVGIVQVGIGDRVDESTTIVTIDDRSTLLIDFRVAEAFANRITVGHPIRATPFAGGEPIQGSVTAVGSRVSTQSRTLPVRASIDNADDRLRPGMAFSVELRFEGEPYPAIDPLALQWDAEGSYVWKVVDGRVTRTAARIVQRETDRVLVSAELSPEDEVVTEGVLSLRDGATVRIAGTAGSAVSDRDEGAGDREATPADRAAGDT